MPESRRRKPKKQTVPAPQTGTRTQKRKPPSPPWFGALILALFLIGVAYLLVYYFSNGGVLGMEALEGWNILVGFGFIVIGLGLSTQWR